ncbi:FAD:protein FMN transferase [Clostridium sp. UBA4548]|uniref:FAD:protein FMN transferase n=1 Tax=Clostridium sp. UBA4548 TaxID=1946361 RepID=UPI0025C381BA|nr:FAD:protein FMN transferase [Clostridium sp. UBA4548]
MKSFKSFLIFILCFIATLSLSGCKSNNSTSKGQPLAKTEVIIGTACTISLYDNKDPKILDEAFTRLKELEDILSINKLGTELDKVNEMAGKAPVEVSNDTFLVVSQGLKYSKLSGGALDITIGPLVKLWGIGTDAAKLPTEEEISEKKALINYKDLVLDENNKSIFLKRENMIIDLGAIAKGYAADEVASLLTKNNVKSAIIDLGGNIFAVGSKIDGSNWKIGVQDPEDARGSSIGYIEVTNKSIVTSGIYERFFESNGKKYHHILNPKTGYPYENEILGVSILTDKSIDGDSLSTTLFALGIDKGLEFINAQPGTEAIFVSKDHKLYLTEGLKSNFHLTSSKYEIVK